MLSRVIWGVVFSSISRLCPSSSCCRLGRKAIYTIWSTICALSFMVCWLWTSFGISCPVFGEKITIILYFLASTRASEQPHQWAAIHKFLTNIWDPKLTKIFTSEVTLVGILLLDTSLYCSWLVFCQYDLAKFRDTSTNGRSCRYLLVWGQIGKFEDQALIGGIMGSLWRNLMNFLSTLTFPSETQYLLPMKLSYRHVIWEN